MGPPKIGEEVKLDEFDPDSHESSTAWKGESWKVIHGDWSDFDPDLPKVDHVLTDPPYDEKTHKGAGYSNGRRYGIDEFDPIEPVNFVPRLLEASNRWVICFGSTEMMGAYADVAGAACWVRAGWWRKANGMPQMSGDRPAVPGEAIAIMHPPSSKEWNGGGKHAFWEACKARGKDREHPTQKPVDLCQSLVEDFTDRGDLILDPFAGLASIGIAAVSLGRRYLGVELEEEWARMGAERLESFDRGLLRNDLVIGQSGILEVSNG